MKWLKLTDEEYLGVVVVVVMFQAVLLSYKSVKGPDEPTPYRLKRSERISNYMQILEMGDPSEMTPYDLVMPEKKTHEEWIAELRERFKDGAPTAEQ